MGWFTKLLKGSSNHKISPGQYHGKYGDDRIWDNHHSSGDDLTDIEKEDIDRAIALSLSEEDLKGKKVAEDDSQSEEDEQLCKIDEEEDEHLSKVLLEEDEHLGKVQPEEDELLGKVQLDEDELLAILARDQLEEDEQLARAIQESLNIGSPPRHDNDSLFQSIPHLFPPGYRICAGCNAEIGQGRFLSCMGAVWHPQCFRCHACHLPITDYEFSLSSNRPYHKSCYREKHQPRCDVCKKFIPPNSAGLIEYRAHPFWMQKYCPSHELDGTPRCCSCERMEPRDTKYLLLDDGRKLCLECLDSSIMDTDRPIMHVYRRRGKAEKENSSIVPKEKGLQVYKRKKGQVAAKVEGKEEGREEITERTSGRQRLGEEDVGIREGVRENMHLEGSN